MLTGREQPSVEIDGLWEGYRAKSRRGWRRRGDMRWALHDVSMAVAPGELVGVIGGNGSGKSTLLQCIGGILRPSRGTVVTRGRVGTLVDLLAGFHRELTGRENLLVAAVLSGCSRAEVRGTYEEIVAFSELDEDTMNSPLRTYSAGMGLRLGFALTVCTNPRVLAIDEVLAVGDESFQHKCIARLRELRESGAGVVMVSHDLDLISAESDRVAILDHARLVFLGDPGDAVGRYRAKTAADEVAIDLDARPLYGRRARRQRRWA